MKRWLFSTAEIKTLWVGTHRCTQTDFFSIKLDGPKKNLPSCTAATPLTTAIEPAHVAANNCKQKLQVAAWRFFNSIGRFQEKFAIVYCSHTTNYGHRTGPCCRQQLRAKAASSCMKGGGGHKACMRGALCPPPSCSKGEEKRRACMKGLSQTSTTSRSLCTLALHPDQKGVKVVCLILNH